MRPRALLALCGLLAALAVACGPSGSPGAPGGPDGAVACPDGPSAPEAAAPAPPPPGGWGTVRVWVAPAFESSARAAILAELPRLRALGPVFEEAPGPGGGVVEVRPFRGECFADVAHVLPGSRVVELDLSCMSEEEAVATAAGHEIGHALGLSHVCTEPGELPECSPVGYGPALMGPRLRRTTGLGEVFSGARGYPVPTALDRAELLRVYSLAPSTTGQSPDGGR